jgi:hypothetical protein
MGGSTRGVRHNQETPAMERYQKNNASLEKMSGPPSSYLVPERKPENFLKFKSKIPDFERRKMGILTTRIPTGSGFRGLVRLRWIKIRI